MDEPLERVAEQEEGTSEDEDNRFTVRLRVPGGLLSADQLGVLRDVARQHGLGFIRLTARQSLEVPGVDLADLGEVQTSLATAGLTTGSPGTQVRAVVACTGPERCAHAFLDSRALCRALDLVFGGEEFPSQVRIAIAGCPNSCTTPQMADIGLVGTVEPVLDRAVCDGCGKCAAACDERALVMRRGLPRRDPQRCDYCGSCIVACPLKALRPGRLGYTVYVGGRAGRRPQVGAVLARFAHEEEVPDLAARILAFVRNHALPRERVFALIRRVGVDQLRAFVHSRPLHRTPLREAA